MLGGALEYLISQIREMFHAGSETALEQALKILQEMPVPTLDEPLFDSLYARVWGFAILASLLTGAVGLLFSSNSRRQGMTPAQSLLHFVKVYVLALLLPVVVGIALVVSDALVDAALSIPPENVDVDSVFDLPGLAGVVDELMATVIAFFGWVFTWALAIWIMILTWGVLPLMVLTIALAPLAPLGARFAAITRKMLAWLATAIAGKIVVALVLAIGIVFVQLLSALDIQLLVQVFQLITIFMAIRLSLGMKSRFEGNEVFEVLVSEPITANMSGTASSTPSPAWQAVRSGTHSVRTHLRESERHQPARFRRAIAAGLSAAAASPHPHIRYPASAGALIAERMAKKKEASSEGAGND